MPLSLLNCESENGGCLVFIHLEAALEALSVEEQSQNDLNK